MDTTPNINDPRLQQAENSQRLETAKQEHEQVLESREQEHAHAIKASALKQMWFARFASIILCLIFLFLIAGAIWLIVFSTSQVSPGLGFTLGIITTALGLSLKYLTEKIWDFDDFHKLLSNTQDKW